jgi:hypothetical protein
MKLHLPSLLLAVALIIAIICVIVEYQENARLAAEVEHLEQLLEEPLLMGGGGFG